MYRSIDLDLIDISFEGYKLTKFTGIIRDRKERTNVYFQGY